MCLKLGMPQGNLMNQGHWEPCMLTLEKKQLI